jgi:hypothetical protein
MFPSKHKLFSSASIQLKQKVSNRFTLITNMRFSTASLTLALLPSALTWVILPKKLNRREAFELTERDDSASDGGWIVPANVTVEGSEPGDDWIPMAEYLKSQGITPLETLDDPSNLEEHMDPLPLPPVKRELFSRRESDTRVNIGKKLTDYGCDASIRKPIEEALNALCSNGFCDRSQKYTRQVNWLDNGWGSGISRRTLEVSIEGDYRGPRTKGNVIEAAKRAINPDTTSSADRQQKIDSPTCQR